ncbi:MAG: hypothetical protein Q9163_001769 [Psora crenata]
MARPKLGLPAADTTPKKDRLTLTQLAAYDDILTDALVDHVYFWTTIRKNRSKYNLTRGINEDDVTNILLYDVIVEKDIAKAEARLLQLPRLRKYFNGLQTAREKEDFKRHMRKYICMWLPECPFEVSTTNRYTITTHEAATTARRFIRNGETIKYLCGNLVAMTPDEEKDMDLTRRDFSVVLSSRKKTPSLFLGPARFSNHDCNANARLVTKGAEGMVIVANQDINIGDEITVNYGEHYFGHNNCECFCATCESQERGGWSLHTEGEGSSKETTPGTDSEMAPTPCSIKGRRRFLESAADPPAPAMQVSKKVKLSMQRDGFPSGLSTPPASTHKSAAISARSIVRSIDRSPEEAMTIRHDYMVSKSVYARQPRPHAKEEDPEVRTIPAQNFYGTKRPLKRQSVSELNAETRQPRGLQAQSLMDWMHEAGLKSEQRAAQSLASIYARTFQYSNSPSEASSLFDRSQPNFSSRATTPSGTNSVQRGKQPRQCSSDATSTSPSSSTLSSNPSNAVLDDGDSVIPSKIPPANTTVGKRGRPRMAFHELSEGTKRKYMRHRVDPLSSKTTLLQQSFLTRNQPSLPPLDNSTIVSSVELDDEPLFSDNEAVAPIQRTPGDYVRTRLLLSLNHSRWVDCRTCAATWVQANGYQTRKECPRCERHSKLYGYQWPKTENGKNESEPRIMDHRTVHRFIAPEEEREERKRGRGIYKLGPGDIEGSSRAVSMAAEDDEEEPMGKQKRTRSRMACT